MAGTSKTARRSSPTKPGQFAAAADLKRIVPLNGGQGAYLRSPVDGKSRRVAVGSDAAVAELTEWGADWSERVSGELDELAATYGEDSAFADLRGRFSAAAAAAAETVDA